MEPIQPSKTARDLPDMIRKIVGSPHAEQSMKHNVINMASKHLHIPDVLEALLQVLPVTNDKETKDLLLFFLLGLNAAQFSNLQQFHQALLELFAKEKDRSVRLMILQRLQTNLHQDERLIPFFLDLSADGMTSEPEKELVLEAISLLPAISEETALAVLEKNRQAPDHLQHQAVLLAERCKTWNDRLTDALTAYLEVQVDRFIRMRIFDKLAAAKRLSPLHAGKLIHLLRTDTDEMARLRALQCLVLVQPWNDSILAQLFWSASQDSSEMVRSEAARLQGNIPALDNEQLSAVADMLVTDRSVSVRLELLELLKPYMRIREIREKVANVFAGHPSVLENAEFEALVTMLAPYAGREETIRHHLMEAIAHCSLAWQRQRLLELTIPMLKIENTLPAITKLFEKEREDSLRALLFQHIKGLSVLRHPDLVRIFCQELVEPGSPFRLHCATILSTAAESYPDDIPAALENVLLYDQERELVRLCLDGYLRPAVKKRFEVLLEVTRNEVLDVRSRQLALDELLKQDLQPEEQEQLSAVLAGIKPNTLKTPQ